MAFIVNTKCLWYLYIALLLQLRRKFWHELLVDKGIHILSQEVQNEPVSDLAAAGDDLDVVGGGEAWARPQEDLASGGREGG